MEALVKVINEQWAVVMTAPAAFLAALALGGLIGWVAAWIILKQRLDHYKERIEHLKDIVAERPSATAAALSSRDRSETRKQLQNFYIQMGELIDTPLKKDISDEEFEKYKVNVQKTVDDMESWIAENMGQAAVARFEDLTGLAGVSYSHAVNKNHNGLIINQTRLRQNLLAMIESSAWDK